MKKLIISIIFLLCACALKEKQNISNGSNQEHDKNETSSENDDDSQKSVPLTTRVIIKGTLSQNARAVLRAAFETDYPTTVDEVNAYDFPLYGGNKSMDWWNFPWDLPSSRIEINATGRLSKAQSPYLKGSRQNPRDIRLRPEDRTVALGINQLTQMVSDI